MVEPETIYDRRDVVGTLEPTVSLPRALAERALAALIDTLTPAGHLAQKNGREHLGYCGWRTESPRCLARQDLISELTLALGGVCR